MTFLAPLWLAVAAIAVAGIFALHLMYYERNFSALRIVAYLFAHLGICA